MLGGSFAEPAGAPGRGERLLSAARSSDGPTISPSARARRGSWPRPSRRGRRRTRGSRCPRPRSAARALAAEPRGDVVGDDAGRGLREHAGLRHREAHDVADGVDVRERRRQVAAIHGTQPFSRGPTRATTGGTRWTGSRRTGRTAAARRSASPRLLRSRDELDDLVRAMYSIPRSARSSRKRWETCGVTGTGADIGAMTRISVAP